MQKITFRKKTNKQKQKQKKLKLAVVMARDTHTHMKSENNVRNQLFYQRNSDITIEGQTPEFEIILFQIINLSQHGLEHCEK